MPLKPFPNSDLKTTPKTVEVEAAVTRLGKPPKNKPAGNVEKENAKSRPGCATPRPGHGDSLISDDLKAKALAALEDGLQATRRYWDKDAKTFLDEPDHATRARVAELVLAYAEGRPVERQVRIMSNQVDYDTRLEQLLKSPEGVRQALKLGLIDERRAGEADEKLRRGGVKSFEG